MQYAVLTDSLLSKFFNYFFPVSWAGLSWSDGSNGPSWVPPPLKVKGHSEPSLKDKQEQLRRICLARMKCVKDVVCSRLEWCTFIHLFTALLTNSQQNKSLITKAITFFRKHLSPLLTDVERGIDREATEPIPQDCTDKLHWINTTASSHWKRRKRISYA